MSVLLEFSMSPLDQGESVSKFVARSIDIIDQSGIPYQLTPMGTILEGDWDQVMEVVKACYERMSQDCARITASIRIDARKDKEGRIQGKIQSIEKRLGREIRH